MDHEERLLLWAAREAGVLDALLTEAGSSKEVADATGITERAAEITIEALAEYGYFERVGGSYEPTNVRSAPRPMPSIPCRAGSRSPRRW